MMSEEKRIQNFTVYPAKAIIDGRCAARMGWGDVRQFITRQVPSEIHRSIVPKMQSLPDAAKRIFEKIFDTESEQIDSIYYSNQLLIVGRSNLIDSYNPTAEDILAEDWYILD